MWFYSVLNQQAWTFDKIFKINMQPVPNKHVDMCVMVDLQGQLVGPRKKWLFPISSQ